MEPSVPSEDPVDQPAGDPRFVCRHCALEVEWEDAICPHCGRSLHDLEVTFLCNDCGVEVRWDQRWCPKCGAHIARPVPAPAGPDPGRARRRARLARTVAAVLAGASIGAIFGYTVLQMLLKRP